MKYDSQGVCRHHRLTLQIGGQTVYGVAFASEAELEEFIAGRGAIAQTSSAAPPATELQDVDERARGRPSFEAMVVAALKAIGKRQLRTCENTSDRARLVQRHLAKTYSADEIPSKRTLERYLSENPVRQKGRQKSRQKSKRENMASTGGT